MLSYQHIYHAGNFADVHKHAILTRLLQALALKPQKFAVLDTHAGRGLYDLQSEEAQKIGEFAHGIMPFWETRGQGKTPLSDYLAIVAGVNDGDELRFYPGSAKVAQALMRPGDRLTLIERHPGEIEVLRAAFDGARNVKIEKLDGFQCLVDMVPPAEMRGLVLVDPSYEIKTEYEDLPRRLEKAWKKWTQGQFVIWYPMLEAGLHRNMLTALRKSAVKNALVSEVRLGRTAQESFGLLGTGMIIVNPPFGFEGALEDINASIVEKMPPKTETRVYWLDNQPIDAETGMVV